MVLGSVKPREQAGRNTYDRFRAQTRSAAIAALAILEGDVDRVYCDLHDDFVVRYKLSNGYKYCFFQVKTKEKSNYNWTINDLFGISTKKTKKTKDPISVIKSIKDSYAGKMFLHTVNFPNSCSEIVFQTNITVDEKSEEFINNIISGNFSEKNENTLLDSFNEVVGSAYDDLSPKDIKKCLSKLKIQQDVQYIKSKDHRFSSYAIEHIYKYSEIDLSRAEREIIVLKLLDLVSKKSSGVISNYNESTIETESAISINDLLNVLSISKAAYELLKVNGDEAAIKSVSIIQRALNSTNADSDQIMFCAKCKVSWDAWWLRNRNNLPEYKLMSIRDKVNKTLKSVVSFNEVDFDEMIKNLESLKDELESNVLLFDLSMEELIGAFFSELSKVIK
ncbi:dsDNA nuclease domain-containing protein [Marinomonas balearica]|uniref:Uncharacterized protein DUF4297 n=1 Tax=Marinomonas balearica TaxID=491947 RepID=A0A4R6MDU9_9GAMM|nr:dsDNA nuclease domain-containing protein [Marinomonas balearica]TDO99917.1 uncharacterized protein DUF4297 [Marinomonas balearica]